MYLLTTFVQKNNNNFFIEIFLAKNQNKRFIQNTLNNTHLNVFNISAIKKQYLVNSKKTLNFYLRSNIKEKCQNNINQ